MDEILALYITNEFSKLDSTGSNDVIVDIKNENDYKEQLLRHRVAIGKLNKEFNKGLTLFESARFADATHHFDSILANNKHAPSYIALAKCYMHGLFFF